MGGNVLKFSLDNSDACRANNPSDLPGMHLKELLDLLVPVQDGRELNIDGYKLLNDRQDVRDLYSSDEQDSEEASDPLDLYEPRLVYIRRLLESLLGVIEFEADGKPVKVDGFRLKNPNQWLTRGGGAGDIIAHAATRCNLNCRFCYNSGTSPVLKPAPRAPEDEYREIQTRIEHYVPRGNLNLFPNMGSPAEALVHPRILDILRELREKTGEVFRISTNGSKLTSQMIRALAGYAPIYLDVSLNSSSPERRAWLMNDPSPAIAIDSLALLRDAKIPFTVVIVPWPFPSRREMLEDLQSTVSFAAGFDPVLIQISLPGCARMLSEEVPFPLEEVWNELKAVSHELQSRIDCPLVIRPGLFEDYDDPDAPNDPVISGVVKNSPAANAGLGRGDRIGKVNGLPVKSRPQARSLLTTLHRSDLDRASLSIEREETLTETELDLSGFDYPYTPETSTHLGIVFASSGIPREWLERLEHVIAARQAKEVLVLTSQLVKPALEGLLSRNGQFSNVKLHLHIPRNEFFGGNIFMGDLMVVEDFILAAQEFMAQNKVHPDLIVVPSSPFHLGGWGRDLTGRVYLDIERRLGIPVALVECDPIFD